MNRVTSHLPITHKDVRSTTSKTVVWKELKDSPSQMVIAMVAIETLSGASHLPLDWSRYRIGRCVGLIEFIRDCRWPPGLAQYAGMRMSYWCRHVRRTQTPRRSLAVLRSGSSATMMLTFSDLLHLTWSSSPATSRGGVAAAAPAACCPVAAQVA